MAKIKKFYFNLNLNMLLFFLGVLAGTAIINFLWIQYGNTSSEMISDYFKGSDTYNSFSSFFVGIFIRRLLMAAFIIIVFEIFNNIWTVYISFITCGILVGVVLTTLTANIGIKGIGIFFLMCFPHVFLYVISAFILIRIKFRGYYGENVGAKLSVRGYIFIIACLLLGVITETINAIYVLPVALSSFK